jgi:hypothetical protein
VNYPRHYLEFQNLAGLDQPKLATFRLRGTWAKRLKPGEIVFLASVKDRRVIGTARVAAVHSGPAYNMLAQHAHKSHVELGDPELACDPRGAAFRRMESLRHIYGPSRFTETSIISVIELKRLK